MSQKEAPRVGLVRAALDGKITVAEGAKALGLSDRQFRRLKAAYRRSGVQALQHGNRGRSSSRRLATRTRSQIVALMKGVYRDINDCQLTEKLREIEGLQVSRELVRQIRLSERIPAQRRRRAPRHRRRRERQACAGALVLIDGSTHAWLGADHGKFTLHGAVDDATGQLLALVDRDHEDLHGYAELLRDVVQSHGLPVAFYGDRSGILIRNDDKWSLEEQLVGRQSPTQFGRMLEELGIGFIAAGSPQAKGRIERLWGVLQDRLVVELRLNRATTRAALKEPVRNFV